MRKRAFGRFKGVLFVVLVLLSMRVAAQEPPVFMPQPMRRNLYLSKDPSSKVPEVFVAARMVTMLRF